MHDLVEVIKEVNTAPVKYLGKLSLQHLRAYLSGYRYTHPDCHCGDFDGFQVYIEEQYNLCNPLSDLLGFTEERRIPSSHHWTSIIDFFSADEQDAYHCFIQHFQTFTACLGDYARPEQADAPASEIKPLLDVIKEVSSFPERFLVKPSPELLHVFLAGCGHGETDYDTLLDGFREYVVEWSGIKSNQGWGKTICFLTNHEDAAYDGFIQLFNNYLIAKGLAEQPTVTRHKTGDGSKPLKK